MDAMEKRLKVLKTYKIYVDGKFPRTESGRYLPFRAKNGEEVANVCNCSRKDFRDAVTVARAAQAKWAKATAYNRGQILYRIAEMLEGRRAQFVEELIQQGLDAAEAHREVDLSVDRLVHYAGWSDKYQQIFSSVNPVASSHFNFSLLEPTGVISVIAPDESPLLGLVTVIAPAIVGGNAVVVLASESMPLSAVTFGEVLATSDVPGGVVNILTGTRKELLGHMTTHMDVNAVVYCGESTEELKTIETNAALNVKRVATWKSVSWNDSAATESPYRIVELQETKTTWHPIGL